MDDERTDDGTREETVDDGTREETMNNERMDDGTTEKGTGDETTDDGTEWLDDLLVVEENSQDVRIIEEAIEDSAFDPTVHHVSSAEAALDFVSRRGSYEAAPEPDAVLLDWHLSRTTAEDVLEALGASYPDVPVVVMTGGRLDDRLAPSALSEADVRLTKPSNPEIYVETLRSVR